MAAAEKPALKRYFFDTEFNDAIPGFSIDFISIGIVDEDGNEYYGISNEFNLQAAKDDDWLRENVVAKLDDETTWQSIEDIRNGILDFIQPAETIEFWARNGSYDNVLLCQIFDSMSDLRATLKREKGIKNVVFRDINELRRSNENIELPKPSEDEAHISINDARNERACFQKLNGKAIP